MFCEVDWRPWGRVYIVSPYIIVLGLCLFSFWDKNLNTPCLVRWYFDRMGTKYLHLRVGVRDVYQVFSRFTHSRKNRQLHWCRVHPLMYRFLVQRTVSSNLEDGGGWTSNILWNSWIYVDIFGYGSIPINTIFRGMNIHLPAILMFTRGIGFWPIPIWIRHDIADIAKWYDILVVSNMNGFYFPFHLWDGIILPIDELIFFMVITTNQYW